MKLAGSRSTSRRAFQSHTRRSGSKLEMPKHQHSSDRRQPAQEHEPNRTKRQNHEAGADSRQQRRRFRFGFPADQRFSDNVQSAVCNHGAASNARFGKMFHARDSAQVASVTRRCTRRIGATSLVSTRTVSRAFFGPNRPSAGRHHHSAGTGCDPRRRRS
jgi:hypothetical protein